MKKTDRKPDSLGKWIINKVNTNSWRIGKVSGYKHYTAEARNELLELLGFDTLNEQTLELMEAGIIQVEWFMKPNWKRITFPVDKMSELLAREQVDDPRMELKKAKEMFLFFWESAKELWLKEYYEGKLRQIENGDIPADAFDAEFFRCMNEITSLQNPKWMRQFSADVLGDSKAFEEKYLNRTLTVLKKSPKINDAMKDYEIFQEFGIMRYTQTLQWKGSVVVQLEKENTQIDFSAMKYGGIVNSQTLLHMKVVDIGKVKQMMIIENQANYEDMEYAEDMLYVFSHGFFSPIECKILRQVINLLGEDAKVYHWSDMDYGGMRIFQYVMENIAASVIPYRMDKQAYEFAMEQKWGIPLSKEKREKIEKLQIPRLQELKQCILEFGYEIEQEHFI